MTQPQASPESRTIAQSALREIAPVIIMGIAILGGIVWSLLIRPPLTSSPPYILPQVVVILLAFLLATRGAPRWSYPWIAFGIVGTQAVLLSLIPDSSRDVTSSPVIAVALGGPIIAALLASTIAVRNWGDAAIFVGLYLIGSNLGLPIVLRQPADGALLSIEIARVVLLAGQMGLVGAAILAWNRQATGIALGLLATALVLSAAAAGLLVPGSNPQAPADFSFLDFARLVLLIALVTFAVGSMRRVFAGHGFLTVGSGRPFIDMEDEDIEAIDSLNDEAPLPPPADQSPLTPRRTRSGNEPAAPRRRRRRRRDS